MSVYVSIAAGLIVFQLPLNFLNIGISELLVIWWILVSNRPVRKHDGGKQKVHSTVRIVDITYRETGHIICWLIAIQGNSLDIILIGTDAHYLKLKGNALKSLDR
nr:unnamed protein product [Callosobruchus chinensis]